MERGGDVLNVFGYPLHLGVLYIFFALFWLVGFSNAVNLTDGIDGLASISVVISLSAYGVIAYVQNQLDILLVILAMIGGLLGSLSLTISLLKFLWEMSEVLLLEGCWPLFLWHCTKNGRYS